MSDEMKILLQILKRAAKFLIKLVEKTERGEPI